ncbi:MAG: dihydrofolate reductase [Caulobacter sp.]|nr:dihydrofolate reductase [Caulobacter sp.]
MRKLIVTEFVSLDGVMEAPGGEPGYAHTGWVGDHPFGRHFDYKLTEVMETEATLLGRVTYESFAGAWPDRDGPMADKLNAMPKFVISNTMKTADWNNSTVLGGDMVTSVKALKADGDGILQVPGSRTLVHGLLKAGLVDELHLMVFPVILGSGFKWYPEGPDKIALKLAETIGFASGVSVLVYEKA